METHRAKDGVTYLAGEPGDLDRAAESIRQLLEQDIGLEAMTRFSRLRPPDQVDVLARLTRESQIELLRMLTPDRVGLIMEELEPTDAVGLSQDMEPEQLSQVLDETSPEVAADVLRGLSEEVASSTLERMEEAEGVTPLLEYEDDAAGGLMTSQFIALRDTMTVMEAMAFVRRWAQDLDPEDFSYLFAVDLNGVLNGGISLAQLVVAKPYQHISLLLSPDVLSVPVETDQEPCARLMERYNVRNLPVVDDAGKLVGVLKLEDMVDVLEDEATEDMYRMIGVGEEEKALGHFWRSVGSRLPWLIVNLGTTVLAALVITLFQSTILRAVALVAFLPVIAGQGGIAGTQTLTLIVRSLALGEISPGSARRLLTKEVGLALVHGMALAVMVGIIALVWKGSGYLALVVAAAMIINLVVASISGVLVPLGFKSMRIDPALGSAVAVTTVTDVLGFLIYLGLASATIGLITRSL